MPRPIVALAPMADMSDLPFCLLCKQHGTPLMFREMVSSEAIVRLNPKTLKMAEFDERERPLVQQIFGSDPATMAEAARIIEERFHPDAIDINMGCPVYNIVSNFNGAFLIKEPERAAAIIRAMTAAVSVPISVKTRLGWKHDTDCLDFVKVIENAGAALISMHGRTKEQGYSGVANWDRIGEARANVPNTPFLVNGDITTPELAAEAMKRSGADGVLMGRGMLGNPWFAKQVQEYLTQQTSDGTPEVSVEDRVNAIKEHARMQVFHYGERGLVKLRKHLPWYFKGFNGWKDIRSALVRIDTLQDLDTILAGIK
ncbi:tRNA dihydrouridine synthase DusB [Patescibacteria group bacterium]|nr:tRNA dihydrouridine synthase DusB [Patescibacteria group bacterium]MBP9709551.1 tRNA dihydrouridine synthase DusB [Patescibacteria group bacterium]